MPRRRTRSLIADRGERRRREPRDPSRAPSAAARPEPRAPPLPNGGDRSSRSRSRHLVHRRLGLGLRVREIGRCRLGFLRIAGRRRRRQRRRSIDAVSGATSGRPAPDPARRSRGGAGESRQTRATPIAGVATSLLSHVNQLRLGLDHRRQSLDPARRAALEVRRRGGDRHRGSEVRSGEKLAQNDAVYADLTGALTPAGGRGDAFASPAPSTAATEATAIASRRGVSRSETLTTIQIGRLSGSLTDGCVRRNRRDRRCRRDAAPGWSHRDGGSPSADRPRRRSATAPSHVVDVAWAAVAEARRRRPPDRWPASPAMAARVVARRGKQRR